MEHIFRIKFSELTGRQIVTLREKTGFSITIEPTGLVLVEKETERNILKLGYFELDQTIAYVIEKTVTTLIKKAREGGCLLNIKI